VQSTGTSEYQAAWIIDEGEDDEENDEEEEDGMSDDAPDAAPMADDGEEEARGDIIDEDETGEHPDRLLSCWAWMPAAS
jgi:hypothetical protein